jgi:hypothetical protein
MSTSLSKVVPNATIKVLKELLVSRGVGVVGVCMETWNELNLLVLLFGQLYQPFTRLPSRWTNRKSWWIVFTPVIWCLLWTNIS